MIKTEIWNGHEIRFVEKEPGDWWAIAKDVADALGYSETNAMTRHLKKKFLTSVKLTDMNQRFTAISEFGIYKAIFKSEKPEAEEFQEWVFDVIKALRETTGLEGFQVFRMLDKDHQKEAMKELGKSFESPTKVNFIKANTIANKAISTKHGHPKMIKKKDMSPEMLVERQPVLDDTVRLMSVSEEFGLGVSVSEEIYKKYLQ